MEVQKSSIASSMHIYFPNWFGNFSVWVNAFRLSASKNFNQNFFPYLWDGAWWGMEGVEYEFHVHLLQTVSLLQ